MADLNTAARDKAAAAHEALPGGRFPIRNLMDLHNAIRAVGRAKGGPAGQASVRRFIIRRAKALGAQNQIPQSWAADGSLR